MRTQSTTLSDFNTYMSKHYDIYFKNEDNLIYEIIHSFILNLYCVDISIISIWNPEEVTRCVHNKKFDTLDDAIDFCNNFQLK